MTEKHAFTEKPAFCVNGYLGILIAVMLTGLTIYLFLIEQMVGGVILGILTSLVWAGFTIVKPNEAKVLTLFGSYVGSLVNSGLWFTIPLTLRQNVSLRVFNFNSKTLKVNDINGNPIEIAAVVVYKVVDTAKALFDVDQYESFVEIQSETALRHVATRYPYDTFEDEGCSLRGNPDEIAEELARELQNRLAVAGVQVLEARLTHLAYATEIASAMLQRQQAMAIIAARQKIVEGAVGMAQMAIEQLQRDGTVELDEERKVNMINNLLVAIVSDRSAQPVINTGSLY